MQVKRREPRSREISESAITKEDAITKDDPTKTGDECSDVQKLESDPIVAELRKLYDGIVDEPVPDQLLDLLRRLDEVERNR